MISLEDYIEEVVEKTEKDIYSGSMPSHNEEAKFWERYEGREEEGHSNSVVGDRNNMREY